MSVHYSPGVTPAIIDTPKNQLITQTYLDPDKIPMLDNEDPEEETPDEPQEDLIKESTNYSPSFSNIASPIGKTDHDDTDYDKPRFIDPLIDDTEDNSEQHAQNLLDLSDLDQYDDVTVPHDVVDYYNENASCKEYGLPRLKLFPLTTRKEVKDAIRHSSCCIRTADKKALQENIQKALLNYPSMNESKTEALQGKSSSVTLVQNELLKPKKRTKEDMINDHIGINATYFNNVFYNDDLAASLQQIKNLDFLNYFYPSFRSTSFWFRVKTSLGGLGMNDEVFHSLGLRSLNVNELNKPLGWCSSDGKDGFDSIVISTYDSSNNWYFSDLSNDIAHNLYCIRLYNILGEIMLDKNFREDILEDRQRAILLDWRQLVQYHYTLYKEAKEDSKDQLKEMQYLYDLFWDFTSNPNNPSDIASNIVSFVNAMASMEVIHLNMNESTEGLITKDQFTKYFVNELHVDDDIFLLPTTLEFPVFNEQSVKLAMDRINEVEKSDRKEFVKNLNRKYKELGCKFSISIDHPYAEYADQNIIDHMVHYLMEGDTAVDDEGTSSGHDDVEPWYKRLDYANNWDKELYPDKNMGPSKDDKTSPDYERFDSFL